MSHQVNIQTLQAHRDSARAYKWDLTITGISDIGPQSTLFNGRCSSIDVPNPTFNMIDINVRGFTKKEAGAIDWNPITLTVYEIQSYTQLAALYNLGQKQFDYTTGYQYNKDTYVKDINAIQIDLLSLQDMVQGTWCLHGCVMETFAPPQMTADKGTAIEIPFTVHYDYATYKIGDTAKGDNLTNAAFVSGKTSFSGGADSVMEQDYTATQGAATNESAF